MTDFIKKKHELPPPLVPIGFGPIEITPKSTTIISMMITAAGVAGVALTWGLSAGAKSAIRFGAARIGNAMPEEQEPVHGGPEFLGFVFIEPNQQVSFFGPQLDAQQELAGIFENAPTDAWSMAG
jgi:hypothetical protein